MTIRYASYEDFVLGNKIIEQPKVVNDQAQEDYDDYLAMLGLNTSYDDLIEDEQQALLEEYDALEDRCEVCGTLCPHPAERGYLGITVICDDCFFPSNGE